MTDQEYEARLTDLAMAARAAETEHGTDSAEHRAAVAVYDYIESTGRLYPEAGA